MITPATLLLEMEKKSVHLPEEVIIEILLRLPVKSVLRCRCVCKSWLSIISHHNFATSHFQLAASPTHRLLIFKVGHFSYDSETLSIDFNASLNDDSTYHSLSLDFLPGRSDPELIGSCRGFLLLDCYKCLYLWNPSTGVNKQISLSPITLADNDADNHYILNFLYGLAYEPSTDDYLVVSGSYECDDDYRLISSSLDLEIFSLRANKWKQIDADSPLPYENYTNHCANRLSRVGLFLNGAIHWLVYNDETNRDVIIAFDIKEMRMYEIALPNDFNTYYSPVDYDVLVLNGLISVWVSDFDTVEIWVMQEYKVYSSWTYSKHPAPDVYFSLLCFTNCGDIVVTDREGGLKKFNDKGKLLERHIYYRYRLSRGRNQMAMYTESLLSLPSGIDQA